MVDIFLDHPTDKKFKQHIATRNIDESQALAEVLERGLANYWLLEFKRLKENYHHIKPLYDEFKKENETLNKLEEENENLKKILENRLPTKEKACSKAKGANA